jgi:hypothetical protein
MDCQSLVQLSFSFVHLPLQTLVGMFSKCIMFSIESTFVVERKTGNQELATGNKLQLPTNVMQSIKVILFSLFLSFSWSFVFSQQLVLVKKNKVRGRFNANDEIRYSLARRGSLQSETIRSINDTSFITSTDTVLLSNIKRVDGRTTYDFTRSLGIKMMTAGFLLHLGDYLTVTLVQSEDYTFNPGVTITSSAMVITGFLLQWLRKPYIVLSRNSALLSVSRDSPMFRR